MAHTPGPWAESNISLWTPEHETSGNNVWTVIRSEEADQDVAIVMEANAGWRDTPELDATARLIAAAPLLLAAVIAAEDYFATLPADDAAHPLYLQMNAAIAAARQESAS